MGEMLQYKGDHKTGDATKGIGKEEKKAVSLLWLFMWCFPCTALERAGLN